MTRTTGNMLAVGAFAAALALNVPAAAELKLAEPGGWVISTDGRVNAFLSVAHGTRIPENEPDFEGSVTKDTEDTNNNITSSRIRNGFLTSILGTTLRKELSPEFKVTARVALWMNIGGARTKNIPGLTDPREIYGKIEGSWGSLLGGSDLAIFGRGGILTDARIAHEYGVGYPCAVEVTSGGACGMAAFGAVFPGYEPGFVYTTPKLLGVQLALGVYDPVAIALGELNRAPLPRFEAELSYELNETIRVFASGFWQMERGTTTDTTGTVPVRVAREANAWGGQAGAWAALGPVMVGGAAFTGRGFSPITYADDNRTAVDTRGVLRSSRGGFALAAFTLDALRLKLAGGGGVFLVDKTVNDPDPISAVGLGQNPQLLKQNLGVTVGLYQTTGPVHFALEYFRAEHTLYEYGQAHADNPNLVDIKRPQQAVNFVNAGMTIGW
jgi:hypothetical protein